MVGAPISYNHSGHQPQHPNTTGTNPPNNSYASPSASFSTLLPYDGQAPQGVAPYPAGPPMSSAPINTSHLYPPTNPPYPPISTPYPAATPPPFPPPSQIDNPYYLYPPPASSPYPPPSQAYLYPPPPASAYPGNYTPPAASAYPPYANPTHQASSHGSGNYSALLKKIISKVL